VQLRLVAEDDVQDHSHQHHRRTQARPGSH
jgi:hypothetical protein